MSSLRYKSENPWWHYHMLWEHQMHGSYHIPLQVLFVKLNYASASHVKILLKTLLGNQAKFCITYTTQPADKKENKGSTITIGGSITVPIDWALATYQAS